VKKLKSPTKIKDKYCLITQFDDRVSISGRKPVEPLKKSVFINFFAIGNNEFLCLAVEKMRASKLK